ncbi:MAG TPA: hypothetical protein VF731_01765 [Solirubrobacterales bacterium]
MKVTRLERRLFARAARSRRTRRIVAALAFGLWLGAVVVNAASLAAGRRDPFALAILIVGSVLLGWHLGQLQLQPLVDAQTQTIDTLTRIPTGVHIRPDESGELVAWVQTLGGGMHVIRIPGELRGREEVASFVMSELGFEGTVSFDEGPPDGDD